MCVEDLLTRDNIVRTTQPSFLLYVYFKEVLRLWNISGDLRCRDVLTELLVKFFPQENLVHHYDSNMSFILNYDFINISVEVLSSLNLLIREIL